MSNRKLLNCFDSVISHLLGDGASQDTLDELKIHYDEINKTVPTDDDALKLLKASLRGDCSISAFIQSDEPLYLLGIVTNNRDSLLDNPGFYSDYSGRLLDVETAIIKKLDSDFEEIQSDIYERSST